MKREARHYAEEELLMHLLEEESSEAREEIARHLVRCRECAAVVLDLQELRKQLSEWRVPEVAEETWNARKDEVLELLLREGVRPSRRGYVGSFAYLVRGVWDYALSNPLPALGYIVAALAFASERTITVLRLDDLLPATGELIEILRQVL